MDGEFSQADAVFAEARKNNFPIEEEQRIQFRPGMAGSPTTAVRLVGIVSSVKAGYAWINVDGYPPCFCPGSKYHGIIMKQGLRIEFRLGFNARGSVALEPKLVQHPVV